MSDTAVADWRAEAVRLRDVEGLSERQIAERVEKAPSTVHQALKDYESNGHAPIPGQTAIPHGDPRELEENAGEAVGAMPQRPVEESVYVEEIRVDGTTQVAIDFGGKRAQSCSLSLSGKAEVDGFFRKGDRIRGTFEAVVDGAGGKDKIDKQTGIVVEAAQRNTARITDLILKD